MAKTKRREFTSAFKKRAVKKVLAGHQTLLAVAEELKLHPSVLTDWKKKHAEGGDEGLRDRPRGRRRALPASSGRVRTPAGPTRALALFGRRQPTLPGAPQIVAEDPVVTQLYAALGRLTVENEALRRQLGRR